MKRYIVHCRRTVTETVEVEVEVGGREHSDHAKAKVDLEAVDWSGAERREKTRKTAYITEWRPGRTGTGAGR